MTCAILEWAGKFRSRHEPLYWMWTFRLVVIRPPKNYLAFERASARTVPRGFPRCSLPATGHSHRHHTPAYDLSLLFLLETMGSYTDLESRYGVFYLILLSFSFSLIDKSVHSQNQGRHELLLNGLPSLSCSIGFTQILSVFVHNQPLLSLLTSWALHQLSFHQL